LQTSNQYSLQMGFSESKQRPRSASINGDWELISVPVEVKITACPHHIYQSAKTSLSSLLKASLEGPCTFEMLTYAQALKTYCEAGNDICSSREWREAYDLAKDIYEKIKNGLNKQEYYKSAYNQLKMKELQEIIEQTSNTTSKNNLPRSLSQEAKQ
jgi:hypothetical protein